jgi:hypothetical protein
VNVTRTQNNFRQNTNIKLNNFHYFDVYRTYLVTTFIMLITLYNMITCQNVAFSGFKITDKNEHEFNTLFLSRSIIFLFLYRPLYLFTKAMEDEI